MNTDMKLKSILVLLLLFCFTFSVAAQNRPRQGGGRFDIQAFNQKKAEYLKKELNLTDAEAKAFLPLEAEFSMKKYEIAINNKFALANTFD